MNLERAQRNPRNRAAPRPARASGRPPATRGRAGKRSSGARAFAELGDSFREWIARRKPIFALGLLLAAVAVVAMLFVGGAVARAVKRVDAAVDDFAAEAGFGIAEVRLAGNVRTRPETILAALGFQPGQSIFGADLRAARARLLRLDWVTDAEVRRRYPDAISVRLIEKLPFALWKSPNGVFVVERSGGRITDKDVSRFAALPLLDGAGAPEHAADIVDAVAQRRAVAARVKVYQRKSDRRWNLILDDGVVVELPETGWQKELDTLESLIVDKSILERNISEIDLRSPTHYFFVLKGDSARRAERGSEL
ncbi:MAG TPA: FtsQ-type POTRA domain-containing protein [Rhizomicrobium sp.]|nr:FtsQ-type POTRA domain-containing protein [Rhizomicrobium sp.]